MAWVCMEELGACPEKGFGSGSRSGLALSQVGRTGVRSQTCVVAKRGPCMPKPGCSLEGLLAAAHTQQAGLPHPPAGAAGGMSRRATATRAATRPGQTAAISTNAEQAGWTWAGALAAPRSTEHSQAACRHLALPSTRGFWQRQQQRRWRGQATAPPGLSVALDFSSWAAAGAWRLPPRSNHPTSTRASSSANSSSRASSRSAAASAGITQASNLSTHVFSQGAQASQAAPVVPQPAWWSAAGGQRCGATANPPWQAATRGASSAARHSASTACCPACCRRAGQAAPGK